MTLAKTILLIILDVILNEKGYERSTSQQTMYGSMLNYKTIEESDKPISTCLLDHMKNDVNFSNKNPRISNKQRDFQILYQHLKDNLEEQLGPFVFETLVSNEALLNQDSTVQDVTAFLKKASKILQRTIKIVDLKGGEQTLKFKSATNVQAEPYYLCFVQHSDDYVVRRGWLSITPKNVQNTLAVQKKPSLEDRPLLNRTGGFSQVMKFFRR